MKVSIGGLVLVMAFVMGFGPLAQAQDAPREHSMTGCLKAGSEAGKFMLTDLERGPDTVEIAEATPNMTPHVGHKVTITGTRIPDAPGHTMKVTAMQHVSPMCP